MTTACIVQARMNSTRLPGKVMLPLGGHPVLWHVLTRCQRIPGIDMVICAVPADPSSEPIAGLCAELGVPAVCGPEDDVLARFWMVAQVYPHDNYMRVTADCPLIDPTICGNVLALLPDRDFASNVIPRGYPQGLDCEAFTYQALSRAHIEATTAWDREHVTPWMGRNLDCVNLTAIGAEDYRLTLDTASDYTFLQALFRTMAA